MIFWYSFFDLLTLKNSELENYFCLEELEFIKNLEELDRIKFVSSRLQIKKTLTQLAIKYFNFSQINSLENKTYLTVKNQKIFYSISYSESKGVVVFGEQPIGVDFEIIKPRRIKFTKIASQKELKIINEKNSLKKMYLIWCMKEACMKLSQSSFSFLDYQITSKLTANKFVLKQNQNWTNNYNVVNNNYIISFAIRNDSQTNINSRFTEHSC